MKRAICVLWGVFELLSLLFLCAVLVWGLGQLAGCAVEGDDQADAGEQLDAAADAEQLADAGPDAEPCGATWGPCCANDAPGGRCNPEAICNASGVCEEMCFPFCADAAPSSDGAP